MGWPEAEMQTWEVYRIQSVNVSRKGGGCVHFPKTAAMEGILALFLFTSIDYGSSSRGDTHSQQSCPDGPVL